MAIVARLRFGARQSARQPSYVLGADVTVWAEFRDSATAVLTPAANVTFALIKADGTALSPAPTVINDATGIYRIVTTPDQVGAWRVSVDSTTSGVVTDARLFAVSSDTVSPSMPVSATVSAAVIAAAAAADTAATSAATSAASALASANASALFTPAGIGALPAVAATSREIELVGHDPSTSRMVRVALSTLRHDRVIRRHTTVPVGGVWFVNPEGEGGHLNRTNSTIHFDVSAMCIELSVGARDPIWFFTEPGSTTVLDAGIDGSFGITGGNTSNMVRISNGETAMVWKSHLSKEIGVMIGSASITPARRLLSDAGTYVVADTDYGPDYVHYVSGPGITVEMPVTPELYRPYIFLGGSAAWTLAPGAGRGFPTIGTGVSVSIPAGGSIVVYFASSSVPTIASRTAALVTTTTQEWRFAASGVWNKSSVPTGALFAEVQCLGGGGGGGGGARAAAGVVAVGGAGGGGGARKFWRGLIADLPSGNIAVTVPAGGLGGAGATTDGAAGAAGAAPTDVTTFGSIVVARNGGAGAGGGIAVASGGGSGGGVSNNGNAGSGATAGTAVPGGAAGSTGTGAGAIHNDGGAGGGGCSAASAASGGGPADGGGPGGAGGGGATAANASTNGGAGGLLGVSGVTAPGGSSNGAAGTAGTAATARPGGPGGGGGAGGEGVTGGAGGAGAPGSGGGGGGGAHGASGGAGGAGGAGHVIVRVW